MSIFQTEISNFTGGLIIPTFILSDPNLDVVLMHHLSSYLCLSQFTDKIQIDEKHYDFECDMNGYLDELVKQLKSMYYINLISRRITKGRIKFKIEIHKWYLEYIDRDPFYGDYETEYHEFLNDVVLPELTDDKIKDTLLKCIFENYTRCRINYLINF